jgi:hypothetical protein
MSTLAIVLIAIGAIVLLLLIGGAVAARRRIPTDYAEKIAAADRALEAARAQDKGWDRSLLEAAARAAIAAERADFPVERLDLVLVDDRPGVEQDRAHLLASGDAGELRVVLTREPGGNWVCERLE